MSLSRDLLGRAFADNPFLRGEFEALADELDAALVKVNALLATTANAAARIEAIESSAKQPLNELLTGISELPDDVGAIELLGNGQVAIRGIDATDAASLVSRGKAISYGGKGATANRPTLGAITRAIYFDTTLAASGKPVFWTGAAWVDANGAAA